MGVKLKLKRTQVLSTNDMVVKITKSRFEISSCFRYVYYVIKTQAKQQEIISYSGDQKDCNNSYSVLVRAMLHSF